MSSSNSYPHPPRRQAGGGSTRATLGVTDFLQKHDKLGTLLPTLERLGALEKACATALPAIFDTCSVLNLEAGQLALAAPNAALASKLKQQLPKLQNFLQQHGWQVNAIRIKVQVGKIHEKSITSKQIALSNRALTAFAALENSLEPSNRNASLKAALQAMLNRHREGS
jgi:hypothetical protein